MCIYWKFVRFLIRCTYSCSIHVLVPLCIHLYVCFLGVFDPLSLVVGRFIGKPLNGEAPVFPRKFGGRLVQYMINSPKWFVCIHGLFYYVHCLWHIYWHHKDWAETRCSCEKVALTVVYECKECSVVILKTLVRQKLKSNVFFPLNPLGCQMFTPLPQIQFVSPKDYAPKIAENGLDPTCGHLAKGSWLGGAAGGIF